MLWIQCVRMCVFFYMYMLLLFYVDRLKKWVLHKNEPIGDECAVYVRRKGRDVVASVVSRVGSSPGTPLKVASRFRDSTGEQGGGPATGNLTENDSSRSADLPL